MTGAAAGGVVELDFTASPTISEVVQDDESFVLGVVGPFGSGKSVGMAAWVMSIALTQEPAKADNIRYTRLGIIRNTQPELKSTTINTFTEVFPVGAHGRVVFTSPITYHIQIPARQGQPGVDCKILFIGLDKPQDVKHLLSMELTSAWVNEAREVPWAIIKVLVDRLGRYPSKERGTPSRIQLGMDTNPPDEDSWWYECFEVSPPDIKWKDQSGKIHNIRWKCYHQPPAVLEVRKVDEETYRSTDPGFPYDYEEMETVPAAQKRWAVNPEAENLRNLEAGYYARLVTNKDLQHIQCYGQGQYIYVKEGKAVVPEFHRESMVDEFGALDDVPLKIGIDIGGGTLQPAAVIGQRHPVGTWLILDEVVHDEMGVDRFAGVLRQRLNEKWPDREIEVVFTDPAAEKRDEIFETKVNQWLRSEGFPVQSAPTNDWRPRRLAIAQPCGRFIGGRPGLLVHKRCRMLVKGLSGAWHFKRIQGTTAEAYHDTPAKNEYSHPCEALGYLLSGGGEHLVALSKTARGKKSHVVPNAGGFSVFSRGR